MKRKAILFLLTVIAQMNLFAQNENYRPFVEDGKIWHMKYNNEKAQPLRHAFFEPGKVWTVAHPLRELNRDDYWTEKFYFQGDTIISGILCHKMMRKAGEYAGAIHEEGMRVGFFVPGSQTESLLYDFSLTIGDEVCPLMGPIDYYETQVCTVTDTATIQIGDEQVRCILLSCKNPDFGVSELFAVWMEGIGSTCGPVTDIPLATVPVGQFLLKCEVEGNALYDSAQSADVEEIIHNAMDKMAGIVGTRTDKTSQAIYDLTGRPMPSNPKGIYIKGGKKVVVGKD